MSKRLIIRSALPGVCLSLLISCSARPAPAPTRASEAPRAEPAASAAAEPAASAAAEPAASAPAGHLVLGPLRLLNERGNGLLLATDGSVSKLPGEEPVGKLLSDGQFVLASGRRGPRLEPDGHVSSANGEKLPVRIGSDGAVEVGNSAPVHFDDAGRLVGGNPDAPKTEVQGLTPALRRAAAFLLILAAFPVRQ